jgi:murein DD-endopeptidase MepM/ murein hydrolase activator NlpD
MFRKWKKMFLGESSQPDYWYYPDEPIDYGWLKRSLSAALIFGIVYFASISDTYVGSLVIDGVHQVMTTETDVTFFTNQISPYLPQSVAAFVPRRLPELVHPVDPFQYMSKPVEGKLVTRFGSQAQPAVASSIATDAPNVPGSTGIAIVAQIGSPVRAAAQGTIKEVSVNASGQVVRITHSQSLETVYMGLADLLVAPQDKVTQGQVIGRVAKGQQNNGMCYFEVHDQGQPVDPLLRLKDAYP